MARNESLQLARKIGLDVRPLAANVLCDFGIILGAVVVNTQHTSKPADLFVQWMQHACGKLI